MNYYKEGEVSGVCTVYFYTMNANNIDTTGKRIRYLREHVNNWKGTKLIEEVKKRYGETIEPSTLTNHEKDTSMPRFQTLVNYAKTLGSTTDFLLLITDDPAPTKKTDRNVIIEASGEEERRILEEISSLLEETNTGDLRFILDIIRRISSVTIPASPEVGGVGIEPLIGMVLDAIEQVGGRKMRDRAIEDMEKSLPSTPPLTAMWRRFRAKRPNQPLQSDE